MKCSYADANLLHADNIAIMNKKARSAGFKVLADPPPKLLRKLPPGELLEGLVAKKPAVLFLGVEGVCVLAVEEPDSAVEARRVRYAKEAKLVFDNVPSERGDTADLKRAAETANKETVLECMILLAQFIRGEFKG